MRKAGETLFILAVIIIVIMAAKQYIGEFFTRENSIADISELQRSSMEALLRDPLYRPSSLLSEKFDYEPDSIIERIALDKFSLGQFKVVSAGNIGTHYLYLDGKPIFGNTEMITLISAFRKSKIELVFFATQSAGTCCSGYRSLYLLRNIKGLGFGIESLGVIQNGADDDLQLSRRLQVDSDRIMVDMDVWELKHNFINVSIEGGVESFSRELPHVPVDPIFCEFLWNALKEYLEDYKKGKDQVLGIEEHLMASNYHRQMHNSLVNTQIAYSRERLSKISERVIKEGRITLKLKSLFEQQVCGFIHDRVERVGAKLER